MAHHEETILIDDRIDPDLKRNGGPGKPAASSYSRSLWEELQEHKYWIALTGGLAGVATALHFAFAPVLYSSTVVLYVADGGAQEQDDETLLPDRSPRLDQLQLAATSTEMLEHLIKTYELYAHYDVDTTQPLFHEAMCASLSENISVRSMGPNALSITVSDRDRALAPRLANNLYEELHAMTDRQVLAYSQRVAAFYQQLLAATREGTKHQVDELMALAARVRGIMGTPDAMNTDGRSDELRIRLSETVAQLGAANQEIQARTRELEVATAMLRQENLPNILLIQRAMEDMRTQPWLSALGAVVGAIFIGAVLCTLALIAGIKHGHEFLSYFTDAPARE